jgi:hypothetical protein
MQESGGRRGEDDPEPLSLRFHFFAHSHEPPDHQKPRRHGAYGQLEMCEENGRPNDKMLQYFFARAEGGVGLLTTGLIPISHGVDPRSPSRAV